MGLLNAASPLGPLSIEETGGRLVRLGWGGAPDDEPTPLLREAARQLDAYFAGRLVRFDLPLAPAVSDFGRRVGEELAAIPYGETATYGRVARRLGSSARAVGRACGNNPLPVIVPCHRVVAAADAGGYSGKGGLRTKTYLIDMERRFLSTERRSATRA